ncbi:MAG: TetR/AcrR family transcriptional regulator [Ktedonobacteraceae bacterium]|nr:TetR/AcrR family transcriptional regulator [Ktedonobacteraceae bacterium]
MVQDEKKNEFDPRWVRIVEATRVLFLHYGYDHTSMKAIADQARVSKATLYTYWSAKPDLFNSLILWESLRTFDDWLRRVESDLEGEKIGHVLAHGMAAVSANGVLRVLYSRDVQTLGDLLRERGTQLTTQRYNTGLDLIKILQKTGLVRTDLPAEHISYILTVISVGLVTVGELYDPTHFPDFDALATSLGEIIQSALEPPEGKSSGENKSIMLEHLKRQRQATLEALFSIYQSAEGDH